MKESNPYYKFLLNKAAHLKQPLIGTLEITGRCDFNCKMCYIHNCDNNEFLKKELPTEFWLKTIEAIKKSGVLSVLITGGEPMLRPDFAEIYKKCKDEGLIVSINTNGSLITDEIIDLFKKFPPAAVNISLYGITQKTFLNITCCENGNLLDKVKGNIIKLKENNIQVGINITANQLLENELDDIFAFAEEQDIKVRYATYMYEPREGSHDFHRCSPEDSAKYLYHCELMKYGADDMALKTEAFKKNDFSNIRLDDCISDENGISCNAGRCSFWITYDGRLLPCGMMPSICVDLSKSNFIDAWKLLVQKTDEIKMPDECNHCKLRRICSVCAAICHSESGYFDIKPEYVCKMTKSYINNFLEKDM